MKLSRISRSIIVVVFVALLIYFERLDISLIFQNGKQMSIFSLSMKLLYGICLFALSFGYIWMKEKLYKKGIKRKISFIYRYLYLIVVIVILRYLACLKMGNNTFLLRDILLLLSIFVTAFLIKRIIFNISKSDLLSVIGMIAYAMNFLLEEETNFSFLSVILECLVMATILSLQYLIDELKQNGIKTKKYMLLSLVIGLFMGATISLGINGIIWIVVLMVLFLIAENLDQTHLNFPKRIVNRFMPKIKDFMYQLERIPIKKLIISILIAILSMLFVSSIAKAILGKIWQDMELQELYHKVELIKVGDTFSEYAIQILNASNIYYFLIIVYILLLEILSFFLRRRYDTKTTIIKFMFVVIFGVLAISGGNISYFAPLFRTLLIIIAIINTSSIYLNREERIKMLVA